MATPTLTRASQRLLEKTSRIQSGYGAISEHPTAGGGTGIGTSGGGGGGGGGGHEPRVVTSPAVLSSLDTVSRMAIGRVSTGFNEEGRMEIRRVAVRMRVPNAQ